MKVALAHDYLNQWGGAERVLQVFAEMFPDAPIYTLLYDKKKTNQAFAGRTVVTSILDYQYVRDNHRKFIPLFPFAMRFMKIPDEYDLVISSSAGFGKGGRMGKNTRHLAYIHTPLRYAWEQEEYLSDILSKFKIFLAKPMLNYLRRWDYKIAQKPDVLVANSQFIAGKIKRYYGRDSIIIYPPVDTNIFYPPPTSYKLQATSYFLAIGRFLHYKKFDLIIEAFNELGLPLKVVGAGPEENSIKNQVSRIKNIELLPFQKSEADVRKLYQNARAVIFPQVEDFGLVAAESLACGTPVIAYNAGGAKEIVNEHAGVLFPRQTKEHLVKAVQEFIGRESDFVTEIIATQAQKFSKEHFVREIQKTIERYFVKNKTAVFPRHIRIRIF